MQRSHCSTAAASSHFMFWLRCRALLLDTNRFECERVKRVPSNNESQSHPNLLLLLPRFSLLSIRIIYKLNNRNSCRIPINFSFSLYIKNTYTERMRKSYKGKDVVEMTRQPSLSELNCKDDERMAFTSWSLLKLHKCII